MLYDLQKAKKAHEMLLTLKNRTALKILDILKSHDKLNVTDIYIRLRCEQSVASQFLADMKKTGIIKCEQVGNFVYYSINKKRMKQIADTVNELSEMHHPVMNNKLIYD